MIERTLDWLADWVNENRRLRKRVQELLVANNEEVQRRRDAESNLELVKKMTLPIDRAIARFVSRAAQVMYEHKEGAD